MALTSKVLEGFKVVVRSRRAFAKIVILVAITTIVLSFQNRPKVPDIYYTSDPSDNTRKGVLYTCGCSLPPSLQSSPEAGPDPIDGSNQTWDICYESSSLETVDIFMYLSYPKEQIMYRSSYFSSKVEQILHDAYLDEFRAKVVVTTHPGLISRRYFHEIAWGNHNIFMNYTSFEEISNLSRGGYRQSEVEVPINYLMDGTGGGVPILDFPMSYVALTFSFTCKNCTSCDLAKVTDILYDTNCYNRDNGTLQQCHTRWGDCTYKENGNTCSTTNEYQAKCVMYPITEAPLSFLISQFFSEFSHIPDIHSITPILHPEKISFTSFAPKVLYLSLRDVIPGSLNLSHVEVQRGSTAWLSLQGLFPSSQMGCNDEVQRVNVCSSTAICNLFKRARTDKYAYDRKCYEPSVSRCRYIHSAGAEEVFPPVTVDDVPAGLWNELNLSVGDWLGLLCRPKTCVSTQGYFWSRLDMTSNSLGQFLKNKIFLEHDPHAGPGMCFKTHTNVIRHNQSGKVMFMETNCSKSSRTGGYCRLTGRYHLISDLPNDDWHQPERSSNSQNLFVCYNMVNQALGKWLITTLGILFGWLGTVDLVFEWIVRFIYFCIEQEGQKGHARSPNDAQNKGTWHSDTQNNSVQNNDARNNKVPCS